MAKVFKVVSYVVYNNDKVKKEEISDVIFDSINKKDVMMIHVDSVVAVKNQEDKLKELVSQMSLEDIEQNKTEDGNEYLKINKK